MPATDPEACLKDLGLTLPAASKPVAAYIPARRTGNLVFIAGQIPVRDGVLIHKGVVPSDVSLEQAQECARQCVLNGLAALKAAVGTLSCVRQVVRLGVFVASQPGFTDQPKVANGASELMQDVFGEAGRHARSAVGVPVLPLGVAVEVDAIVQIR